jgi:excisionase family DNA binding protein
LTARRDRYSVEPAASEESAGVASRRSNRQNEGNATAKLVDDADYVSLLGIGTREWYSVARAAETLAVSTRTIERRIASKELRATKVGRQWRIHRSWLLAYLLDDEGE